MVKHTIPRIAAWKYTPVAYLLLASAGFFDLYITLHFSLLAANGESSKSALRLMESSIVLAQVGIWSVAMRGATGLMGYAQKINDTPDGRGMLDIAKAMLWLIAYIVLVPLTSSIAEQSLHKPHSHALIVVHNHLPLLAMIAAVAYLYRGSHRLVSLTSGASTNRRWRLLALALFAAVAVLFVCHFYATVPSLLHRDDLPRFALSVRTLLFTYLIPHIAVWLVGVLAILNLWQYSTQVEGSIYRQLFRNLYQGILLIFICTFVAQLLVASTVTLTSFNIGVAIIYAVLLLGIIGYVLVYRGVQRLIKLEAVV